MNKRTLWASLCLVGLIGCSSGHDTPPATTEMYPVQFSVQLSEQALPFDGTKAIPPFAIPEPNPFKSDTDTATAKDIDQLCTVIEYFVFKPGGDVDTLKHRQYHLGDDDFGIIYDSLPAGVYKLAILAHSSVSRGISLNIMGFDKVSDTFHKQIDITVGDITLLNQSITLQRVVGKIEFVATDSVPAQLKSFDIGLNNYQNKVDILTGKGLNPAETHRITRTFSLEDVGKTNISHSFLTFVSAAEEPCLKVDLTAMNTADKTIRQRRIDNIRPIANKTIRYSGRLYSAQNPEETFDISVFDGGRWGGTEDIDLED